MKISRLHDRFRDLAFEQGLEVSVMSSGDTLSEVAIFAEAPGPSEASKGVPLVGRSGNFFWDVMRPHGFSRTNCYVSNVVKRVLAKSDQQKEAISRRELEQWKNLVLWELRQLPNVEYVVLLGNVAIQAFLDVDGIMSWRGSVIDKEIDGRTIRFLCTMNPAHAARDGKVTPLFKLDLAKLERVVADNYPSYEINPIINPSFNEAYQWMDKLQDEGKPVSLDIEVIGGETACIGVTNDDHTGMCVNFRDRTKNRFSYAEEAELMLRFQKLLGDPDTQLIMQNSVYDMAWLWFKDRIKCDHIFFDTLLAHHALYPRMPHNLGLLTTQYTTHPYYKDEKDEWKEGGEIDSFWIYNVRDQCVTRYIWKRLQLELRRDGLEDFFFDHVMQITPRLVEAECVGFLSDETKRAKVVEAGQVEVERLLDSFHEKVQIATHDPTYTPNPNSPKQMRILYFDRMQLVGRGKSTDKNNRTHIINNPRTSDAAKDVLLAVGLWTKEAKFQSTFGDIEVDEDGRFRTEYRQFGVAKAPGRLSSTTSPWDTGGNYQNQPERALELFIADTLEDGTSCELGYFDLAQAEARYVGWDAQIERWIEQFERARLEGGFDAHRALCSEMYNIPYDETPKKDWDPETGLHTLRYIAKRCRHGLNYRMAPFTFAETTGLSVAEAQKQYNIYHAKHPELRLWWRALEREVRRTRMLFNAYGRRLYITEKLDSKDALESIVAFKPQSTIGDKTCRVMYKAQEHDDWPKGKALIIANKHDSLVNITTPKYSKTCLRIMKMYAEEPLMVGGRELIIPADCKLSVPDEQGIHRLSSLQDVEIVV